MRRKSLYPKERWDTAIFFSIEQERVFLPYYSSKLAEQISNDSYGIENMDAKYLAEDLIENELELF